MSIHRTQEELSKGEISSLLFKESLIPDNLLELSVKSVNSIQGIDLNGKDVSLIDCIPQHQELLKISLDAPLKPIPLKPIDRQVKVVGVDVSNAKMGETETGCVYAFRGSIVWREPRSYRFIRCGPLIFHIQENSTDSDNRSPDGVGEIRILSRLRNIFERSLQLAVSKFFMNTIILLDGSLTAGTPDNPSRLLLGLLEASRERRNRVIAISKSTKLVIDGRNITTLIQKHKDPCFINVDKHVKPLFPAHPVHLMGCVLVSKLAENGFPFRIDIDRNVSSSPELSLGLLLANELLEGGYPETLRLAHILSVFTEGEDLAIQSFLTKKYSFRIPAKFNLRRALFGPFGSGVDVML